MNNTTKQLILGCAAFSLSSFALLANAHEPQGSKCRDQANPQECREVQMAARVAQRDVKWHDELKITAAQEPAWQAFVDSFPQPGSMKKEKLSESDAAKMPAPDQMEQRLKGMEKRHAAMKIRLAKLKALYKTLSPEQKTVLDTKFAQFGHHRPHGEQGDRSTSQTEKK